MKKATKKGLEAVVQRFGSQKKAAGACGVDLSTFNRWITGQVWPPKGQLVRERLVSLGVPL